MSKFITLISFLSLTKMVLANYCPTITKDDIAELQEALNNSTQEVDDTGKKQEAWNFKFRGNDWRTVGGGYEFVLNKVEKYKNRIINDIKLIEVNLNQKFGNEQIGDNQIRTKCIYGADTTYKYKNKQIQRRFIISIESILNTSDKILSIL